MNNMRSLVGLAVLALPLALQAGPEEDRKAFQDYHAKRFPKVEYQDFGNGAYALDAVARENWEAIEEFPPYEIALEEGRQLFETPFKNGKTYADCFPNGGIGIKQNYPYFDSASGQVRTLEQDINACREKNGEAPYKWKKGKLASVSAYMAYTSRGNKINVKIPDDPRALAAYEGGKKHFYTKRGQLNFACADCHLASAGMKLRSEVLSPALGHVSHFPVYRAKWGELGTMHRRYGGCNKQVRAKPFDAQSEEYRNLEYFHTYMSNGIEINGPGARK
jgi:sulfur-oxidizing protein SoxA